MEGYTLKRRLVELLEETVSGSLMNDRTTYDVIYDAAKDFVKRTHYLTATQDLSVSANTAAYNLNPEFISLALLDSYNRPYIKYTVGGSDYFIYPQDYANVVLNNDTSTASVPSGFYIKDADQVKRITGTTTSVGASVNGECILTDSTANLSSVAIGDFVHNTTDTSHGIVIEVVSATQLICALFEGTNNDWSVSDAYVIVPQARYQIVFTPTPASSATASIVYTARPEPVYAPYRAYKLPTDAELPICQFAAFLYKYKDRNPNYGDALYKHYELFTRKAAVDMRRGIPEKSGMRVNFSKSNRRSTGNGRFS